MRRRSNESVWALLVLIVASLWLCTRVMGNDGDEFNCIFKGCRCGGGGGGESTVGAGIAASANDYDEPDVPSVNGKCDDNNDDSELDIVCMLDESSTSGDFPHRVDHDLKNSSRFHRRNISDIQVLSKLVRPLLSELL